MAVRGNPLNPATRSYAAALWHRILRMPNDQDKFCGSCLFILTEEGLARRKIRVFFRGFELEENGAACNLLSAGRLIPVLYRTKSQHRLEKFSPTVSYYLFSCRVSSPRVPQSRPAPPPIVQSASETATHSHSPAPLDGRILRSPIPLHVPRKSRSSTSASSPARARCTTASTAPLRERPATEMDRSEICRSFFHPRSQAETARHHRGKDPCTSAINRLSQKKRIPQPPQSPLPESPLAAPQSLSPLNIQVLLQPSELSLPRR